jgi:hypothetical protein
VVDAFVADLLAKATRIRIPRSSRPLVRDPDEEVFAELALTANADYMVTFNTRHLITLTRFGISVVTLIELQDRSFRTVTANGMSDCRPWQSSLPDRGTFSCPPIESYKEAGRCGRA